ncbi:MAG TPA: peptide deformylase [Trueperaceae bacterium]|nr:peptide deformylase [Trueperaceae bacterium]
MIHPIVLYGDPILRRRAGPVTRFDDDLERLAADMVETMYAADGVGLAAPQVGLPIRLFVALEVGEASEEDGSHEGQVIDDPDQAEELTPEQKRRAWGVVREHVIVNPEVVSLEGRQYGRDGCLSLPGLSVDDVPRAQRVVLDYQDLKGQRHRLEAEGYFAHVLQHEYDHLEGVLFFDHLPDDRRQRFLEENRKQLAEWQREARALAKERERAERGRRATARG